MESSDPPDSLYAQQQRTQLDLSVPWWQRNLLLNQPVLFGTWDGVFTTVMVNIFGIIVFLRMGWIVGTAGVVNSILLLIICTSLALITVFSAIRIVERCRIQSGGIYFLVSHVLGGQIGGAVGLIYVFGQAVATGLVAVGFGESVAHFFGSENALIIKASAIAVILFLTVINAAGVSWVIRLQLILLSCLCLAAIDFVLGSLWTVDMEHGINHFSTHRLRINAEAHYDSFNCSHLGIDHAQEEQSFFTVFGVFFANFLGVLAGVNMSGDLREPHKSIPLGELSALITSSSVCFVFIMILGCVVDRQWLLCDNLIQEKVSLTGFFFMIGLYICSLSSVIGSLLGTPRVLQGIASEGIIPILAPLSQGHGANRNPVMASVLMMGIACVFVLLGDLNTLAILSTMPFLITYAFVNYAYVSLAMSNDLEYVTHAVSGETGISSSYGSMQGMVDNDLDKLFPDERARQTAHTEGSIVPMPETWYSMFNNRYISFTGCMINLLILLFINFWFAIVHFLAFAALYYYIGKVCPTCFPGVSQFSVPHMFRTAFSSLETLGLTTTSTGPTVLFGPTPADVSTSQMNEQSADYQQRKDYHHAENIQTQLD